MPGERLGEQIASPFTKKKTPPKRGRGVEHKEVTEASTQAISEATLRERPPVSPDAFKAPEPEAEVSRNPDHLQFSCLGAAEVRFTLCQQRKSWRLPPEEPRPGHQVGPFSFRLSLPAPVTSSHRR